MTVSTSNLQGLTPEFFRKHLKLQGRTYRWLAEQIQFTPHYTFLILNNYHPLSEKHKQILLEALQIELPIEESPPIQ